MANGRTRQNNIDMKMRADRLFQYTIDWIVRDEALDATEPGEDSHEEYYSDEAEIIYLNPKFIGNLGPALGAGYQDDYIGEDFDENSMQESREGLERSLACLYVALTEPMKRQPRVGRLQSFAYIAAMVCMHEVEKFKVDNGIDEDIRARPLHLVGRYSGFDIF